MRVQIKINENLKVDQLVPQSWNELPLRQQLLCYGILMSDSQDLFEPRELLPAKKIQLACALLNIDEAFLEKWEQSCTQEMEGNKEDGHLHFLSQLDQVLACAGFLFNKKTEEEQTTYELKLGLTKCPFPTLERPHRLTKKPVRYHSAADGMYNITIYELAAVFTLFEDIMLKKNFSLVDRLIATLYRPKKPATAEYKRSNYGGDIRLPYLHHESTVDKRQKHMAGLPLPVKQLILFWVASCRQAIVEAYPNVFKENGGEGNDGRRYRWSGVLLSLAGGLVHLDAVARQNHANALTYLSYLEDGRRREKLREV